MENNNYRISESGQFTFYQVPKLLFENARFTKLSTDAKLLYGLLLDRMSLSAKNGDVYLFFTVKEVESLLHFSHEKVGRLYAELEKLRLIERKRQGQGKPIQIYVKRFTQILENRKSRYPKIRSLKIRKPDVKTYVFQTQIILIRVIRTLVILIYLSHDTIWMRLNSASKNKLNTTYLPKEKTKTG